MALGALLKGVIGPLLGPLIDKIPDVNEKRRLEAQVENNILGAITGMVEGQLAINQAEAGHASIFVAGWRPAIGWICGAALVWNFIILPLMMWVAFLMDVDLSSAPELDAAELTTILVGMLGLGGLRTYEKRMGVARKTVRNKS